MANSPKKVGNATAPDGEIKARLLVDCDLGKCNDVVVIKVAVAETMGDQVDADPAAVAYAESIAKE